MMSRKKFYEALATELERESKALRSLTEAANFHTKRIVALTSLMELYEPQTETPGSSSEGLHWRKAGADAASTLHDTTGHERPSAADVFRHVARTLDRPPSVWWSFTQIAGGEHLGLKPTSLYIKREHDDASVFEIGQPGDKFQAVLFKDDGQVAKFLIVVDENGKRVQMPWPEGEEPTFNLLTEEEYRRETAGDDDDSDAPPDAQSPAEATVAAMAETIGEQAAEAPFIEPDPAGLYLGLQGEQAATSSFPEGTAPPIASAEEIAPAETNPVTFSFDDPKQKFIKIDPHGPSEEPKDKAEEAIEAMDTAAEAEQAAPAEPTSEEIAAEETRISAEIVERKAKTPIVPPLAPAPKPRADRSDVLRKKSVFHKPIEEQLAKPAPALAPEPKPKAAPAPKAAPEAKDPKRVVRGLLTLDFGQRKVIGPKGQWSTSEQNLLMLERLNDGSLLPLEVLQKAGGWATTDRLRYDLTIFREKLDDIGAKFTYTKHIGCKISIP